MAWRFSPALSFPGGAAGFAASPAVCAALNQAIKGTEILIHPLNISVPLIRGPLDPRSLERRHTAAASRLRRRVTFKLGNSQVSVAVSGVIFCSISSRSLPSSATANDVGLTIADALTGE